MNWPLVPLAELLIQHQDYIDVPQPKLYPKLSVKLYGKGVVLDTPTDGSSLRMQRHQIAKSGQVILSEIWGKKGAIGFVPPEGEGALCTSHFFLFDVCQDRVESEWLQAIFTANYLQDQLESEAKGTTGYAAVRPKHLLAAKIPLPPLPEQRRIVARIQELAAKIDEACGLRQQAVKEVKVFFAGAKHEVFSKGPTNSWTVKKLDDAAPINMGQSPPGESYNDIGEGIPLLNGPTEFGDRHPKAAQWTTVPTKLCKRGDILLCVRGATTGRMNWADREYCIGRGLAALTPDADVCVPEYVYHFVDTQTQEMLALSAGSTFPNLPGEKLKALPIPLPSVPEQRRIVSYLDSLQVKVDALKQFQAETAAELDAMLPSILDKRLRVASVDS